MYLTKETFLQKVEASGSKYWQEGKVYRWQYMEYAIEEAKRICPMITIEAGASGIPLNSESYLMDYPEYDLNITPYIMGGNIIPEKRVDCFVALQTWEHLDNQPEAFKEVMRISHNAILSFPYMWTWGDKRHKGITRDIINKWTCNVKPTREKLINNRLILTWEF